MQSLDIASSVVLSFLDFSAAFDTVDHNTLINRLEHSFGISGKALQLLISYLSHRSFVVKIGNTTSERQSLEFGVPQGSILGPLFYSLYTKDLEKIANKHGINIHIYADDVVLYTKFENLDKFQKCHEDFLKWTQSNFLKLNKSKTQLLYISRKNSKILKPIQIRLMGEEVAVQNNAKYLGVWIDENLSMTTQVNKVCSQGYFAIKNLWKISSKLNNKQLKTQLIHTCILSKLNYCSSLYSFTSKQNQKKLDRLLKSGVRFINNITGIARRDPITPLVKELHFLPIKYRSWFKINLIVYKCFNGLAPMYLNHLLIPRAGQSLRITRRANDITYLCSHPLERLHYKNQCFRYVSPGLWNCLSQVIRESSNIEIFKSKLKTHYYELWNDT